MTTDCTCAIDQGTKIQKEGQEQWWTHIANIRKTNPPQVPPTSRWNPVFERDRRWGTPPAYLAGFAPWTPRPAWRQNWSFRTDFSNVTTHVQASQPSLQALGLSIQPLKISVHALELMLRPQSPAHASDLSIQDLKPMFRLENPAFRF